MMVKKVKKSQVMRMYMDDKLMEQYKEAVSLAESRILKAINY